MVTLKEIRQKCRKDYWCTWNRLVHEVGFYFTRIFINTRITSNQVTVIWLLLGLIGGIFLARGTYKWMLLGIVLYHLGHFFDCVDGDLARYRNKSSVKGIYLEQISHYITIVAVLIGLTIGVFRSLQNFLWLYIGGILIFSFVFAKLFSVNLSNYKNESRDKVEKIIYESNPRVRNKITSFIFALVRIEHPLNLLFLLILFGFPHIAILIYSALFFFEMCQKLIVNLIKLEKIDTKQRNL